MSLNYPDRRMLLLYSLPCSKILSHLYFWMLEWSNDQKPLNPGNWHAFNDFHFNVMLWKSEEHLFILHLNLAIGRRWHDMTGFEMPSSRPLLHHVRKLVTCADKTHTAEWLTAYTPRLDSSEGRRPRFTALMTSSARHDACFGCLKGQQYGYF